MIYKNLLKKIAILLMAHGALLATVYFDGEDGSVGEWHVYDNTPAGAVVQNINDGGSKVIEFKGDQRRNAYMLGDRDWKNGEEHLISWHMKFSEKFKINLYLTTKKGKRVIYYDYKNSNQGLVKKRYIKIGLGKQNMGGTWQKIERDLVADLKKYEPENEIITVDGMKVQGSGRMDNIQLQKKGEEVVTPPNKPFFASKIIFEDGATIKYDNEEIDPIKEHWEIIKVTPSGKVTPEGATITRIYDNELKSHVLKFQGEGRKNSYLLGAKTASSNFPGKHLFHHKFSWKMKMAEKYRVTIYVQTKSGYRSFYVTQSETSQGFKKGKYIYVGLGQKSMNNQWQTFTLNLDKEIKKYEPNNQMIAVTGMKIQGSGLFDDIMLLANPTQAKPIAETATLANGKKIKVSSEGIRDGENIEFQIIVTDITDSNNPQVLIKQIVDKYRDANIEPYANENRLFLSSDGKKLYRIYSAMDGDDYFFGKIELYDISSLSKATQLSRVHFNGGEDISGIPDITRISKSKFLTKIDEDKLSHDSKIYLLDASNPQNMHLDYLYKVKNTNHLIYTGIK
jgi:hypothetical protein